MRAGERRAGSTLGCLVVADAYGDPRQQRRRKVHTGAPLGQHRLALYEKDKLLWRPGWVLAPEEAYAAEHDRISARAAWLIDGLGRLESIGPRIERATIIVLIDMPLWQHFWLAAERQIAWGRGDLDHRPAGLADMPPTKALFETVWTLDRDWMPKLRELVLQAESSHANGAKN